MEHRIILYYIIFYYIIFFSVDGADVTSGRGRAQDPDMTLGGVSGTISSSSLYQYKVVSFFTFAVWQDRRWKRWETLKPWTGGTRLTCASQLQRMPHHYAALLPCTWAWRCSPRWQWNTDTRRNVDLRGQQRGVMKMKGKQICARLHTIHPFNHENCYLVSWCALSSETQLPSEQPWTLNVTHRHS